jgi:hypothetical protein
VGEVVASSLNNNKNKNKLDWREEKKPGRLGEVGKKKKMARPVNEEEAPHYTMLDY